STKWIVKHSGTMMKCGAVIMTIRGLLLWFGLIPVISGYLLDLVEGTWLSKIGKGGGKKMKKGVVRLVFVGWLGRGGWTVYDCSDVEENQESADSGGRITSEPTQKANVAVKNR